MARGILREGVLVMASNNPQAATQEAEHEEVGIRRVHEFFVQLSMRYLPFHTSSSLSGLNPYKKRKRGEQNEA